MHIVSSFDVNDFVQYNILGEAPSFLRLLLMPNIVLKWLKKGGGGGGNNAKTKSTHEK